MIRRRLIYPLLTVVATALLGGLLGATLVRMSPGFGVSEEEMNFRLSSESREYYRSLHLNQRNPLTFYASYLSEAAKGNFGFSDSFQRPVRELIAERIPVTAKAVAFGVVMGWLLGFSLAMPRVLRLSPSYEAASAALSGIFLCVPSAVLALLFLIGRIPGECAIALIVFPNVFRYTRNLLIKTYRSPHVLAAKARGLHSLRIFLWHVLPNMAAPLIALAGITVSIALGASIPVEVVTDSPGIGQLAWRAALARDVPLLVSLTLIVAIVTVMANSFSDLMSPVRTGDLR
jgi:peptide/nickel transport system permease protein